MKKIQLFFAAVALLFMAACNNVNDPTAITFTTNGITSAKLNEVYTYTATVRVENPDGKTTFEAEVLPEWLTLTDNGNNTATITGVPTEEGEYPVAITATNNGERKSQEFVIVVSENGGGDQPAEGEGAGTAADPYNVAAAIANQTNNMAFVKGIIVGYIQTGNQNTPFFGASDSLTTNILIADAANEKNVARCIPVQLPTGDIRNALNVKDHTENLGKEVLLYGQLTAYFSQPGLKNVTYAVLNGNKYGDEPADPSRIVFSESFLNSIGNFTIQDVNLSEGLSYVWAHSSDYKCMKASAYVGGTNHAAESWLISPAIELPADADCSLSFSHAERFFSVAANELTVWVKTATSDWTNLNLTNYSDGSNFTFVNSGAISLAAYKGQSVQIAFKYVSTSSAAPTWEIKDVVVLK